MEDVRRRRAQTARRHSGQGRSGNREPRRLRREHAVVIGGSVAGLFAARVLSDHFSRVTIVERDQLGDRDDARKGVPQGRHFHVLLKRGEVSLQRWFPDLAAALVDGGATVVDIGGDMQIFQFGEYKVRCPTDARLLFLTRPFLERHIRQRVLAAKNVTTMEQHEVRGLIDVDGTRVNGVGLRDAGGLETPLACDLVVDASGRGSQAPAWLESLNYRAPAESTVTVNVTYTSRLYRRRATDLPGALAAYVLPEPPQERRFGALFPMEGQRWIVTMGGWLGDHAPPTDQAFLAFARSLPSQDIATVLAGLEPATDFAVHKFPANRRRHFERLERFPAGFLVLGDAVCSFNPIYGQGISIAALEAEVLDESLRAEASGAELWRTFFSGAARVVDPTWLLTTSQDFRYPAVAGRRRLGTRMLNWYVGKIYRAAARDPEVYRAFLRVLLLVRPLETLLRPALVLRIILASGRAPAPRYAGLALPAARE